MAGWGTDRWGTSPWGGVQQVLVDNLCDLVLFEGTDLDNILTASGVLGVADSVPTQLPTGAGTLCFYSGELGNPDFSTSVAYVQVVPAAGVNNTYTLEVDVTFEDLPPDFSDLPARHLAFGVTDKTGPCASIFVSQVGLGYAGAFHHSAGVPLVSELVLDSAFLQIPGTAGLIQMGVLTTIRIAVSGPTNSVYVFMTPTADLPVIGHQLVAILPTIDASELVVAPSEDRTIFSVDGTLAHPSRACMERWCLSSDFVTPNIRPIANAGQDLGIRQCNIALFDGSASFDPEGGNLLYSWRLIDGPSDSEFVDQLFDGRTFPDLPPTGFTGKFHSPDLEALHAVDPILAGDVVLVDAVPRTITGVGVDGNGFHVTVALADFDDALTVVAFKILHNRGLSGADTVSPTFFADIPGFYKFDLIVFDGNLTSLPSQVILNVLESALPRGCTPDVSFIFNYLSDFWQLVEESDKLPVFWSALSQVAATELFTLWQYEYCKSLRDIQRTIARRWLHYDLLLAEPLPEITRLRILWSGVESGDITNTGPTGINGTTLTVESPAFNPPVTFTFANSDDSPDDFRNELQARLQAVDSRFSVELLPDKASPVLFKRVRIDAPFPFELRAGFTTPVFTAGDTNGIISGGSGAAVGVSTYVVDRSLVGLGLQEDDLLVLAGIGYRILQVISGGGTTSDQFEGMRLVLKDTLPIGGVSTDWAIPSVCRSELVDFYNGLVSAGDTLFFEISESSVIIDATLVKSVALGTNEALPGHCAFDHMAVGVGSSEAVIADGLALGIAIEEGATILFAKALRRTYLPISELVVDLPVLQELIDITDDEAPARRNVDYYLEEFRGGAAIRFESSVGNDLWEGKDPPDRLWAEYTFIDNRPVIEANFGIPADFTLDKLKSLPTDVDYLAAVQGLWYAYFNGPTLYNIRVGVQIFLGLPFAEAGGIIEEIRDDFSPTTGRILVRDTQDTQIVRAYRYKTILDIETNPDTGVTYVVGDKVKQFSPLVEGADIIDYVKDPTWFKPLMNQGIFTEVQKYFSFQVRIQSDAFDLSSLELVQDFVLRIKPTYTHPVYIIELVIDKDGSETTVDVTDEIKYDVKLTLVDNPCGQYGATMFDAPNPAGGGYRNQFDADDDPLNALPTIPNADVPVVWAFDQEYLCPEDVIFAQCDLAFTGPAFAAFDQCFSYDSNVTFLVRFEDLAGSFALPVGPSGLAIPFSSPDVYPAPPAAPAPVFGPGTLSQARLIIVGGPGADPTDYEFVVTINAVQVGAPVPFTSGPFSTEVVVALGGDAVVDGDVIGMEVRVPVGSPSPSPRSPAWTSMEGRVETENGAFSFDMTLPTGLFTGERLLT